METKTKFHRKKNKLYFRSLINSISNARAYQITEILSFIHSGNSSYVHRLRHTESMGKKTKEIVACK